MRYLSGMLLVISISFIITSSNPNSAYDTNQLKLNNNSEPDITHIVKSLAVTWIYDPVIITNDSTLAAYATAGDGSASSPYMISDYYFAISGSLQVQISNTTASFKVVNCTFSGYSLDFYAISLEITDVPNGTVSIESNEFNMVETAIRAENASSIIIRDNILYPDIGVYLIDCNNSIVENNEFGYATDCSIRLITSHNSTIRSNFCNTKNWYGDGIIIENSDFITIISNNCTESSNDGIRVVSSYYPYIVNNRLIANQQGLNVISCSNAIIFSNYFANNTNTGLKLKDNSDLAEEDLFVSNNLFFNDGILISESSVDSYLNYDIKDTNLINGKPYGLFANVSDGTINAQVYGQVLLAFCNNTSLINVNISNVLWGVTFEQSYRCNLTSGILRNTRVGAYLHNSELCWVKFSTFSFNSQGVFLYSSENSSLYKNTFADNSIGVKTSWEVYPRIINNTFVHCGLYVDEYSISLIIENNTINSLKLGYFEDQQNIIFDTDGIYGQILFHSCSDLTIRDLSFSNIDNALLFTDSSNITIERCFFQQASKAVTLYSCKPIVFTNNTFYNNSYGIYGVWAQNINMEGNNFTLNFNYGVYLDDSRDKGSNITNNLFHSNGVAFYVDNGFLFRFLRNSFVNSSSKGLETGFASSNFLIKNNNFTINNAESLYLYKTDNCTVIGNRVNETDRTGFRTSHSDHCVFTENIFYRNTDSGLMFGYGTNNYAYNNTFIENGFHDWENTYYQVQVSEEGNYLYNETLQLGNSWSDYDGSGTYQGNQYAIDLYPTITPGIPRILGYLPHDRIFREDTGGFQWEFSWRIIDDNPRDYQIYLNGGVIVNESWEIGKLIEFSLYSHSPGLYNYTLIAFDLDGQFIQDEVLIEIESIEKYAPHPICLSTNFSFTEGISKEEFSIIWNVTDLDNNPRDYGVHVNNSFYEYGDEWAVGVPVEVFIGDLTAGTYSIRIMFQDMDYFEGEDTVEVIVLSQQQTSSSGVATTRPSTTPSSQSPTPISLIPVVIGFITIKILKKRKRD